MITSRKATGVTHQQIADHLGISRQLVTHALNGTLHSRISEETRNEIKRVAREFNYRPRNLTTHNIGYLLPNEGVYLETEHTLAMMVEKEARAAGYRLLVVGVRGPEDLESLSEVVNAKTVDGVICPRWYGERFRDFLPRELPWIAATSEAGVPDDVDIVSTDTRLTSAQMTAYLLDRGHTRIGLACAAADIRQHRDLYQGMEDAFHDHNLPLGNLCRIRGKAEEIPVKLNEVINSPAAPTAWIASTPRYATAVLFQLYSQGRAVPKDVSVMSFVDSPYFDSLPFPLTATTAVGPEVAAYAVNRLVERIRGANLLPTQEYLPAKILERQSVGPPPHAQARKKKLKQYSS